MRPHDDPSWDQYPETILEFFREPEDDEPVLTVDLRAPVVDDARDGLADLGLDGPFGIVTAAAPRGEPVDDAFDRARQADLEEVVLLDEHVDWLRVDGVSPDGRHRERSIALRLPRDRIVALGRHYQQSAVFWFDGESFWLVGAVVAAEARRLPVDEGVGRRA